MNERTRLLKVRELETGGTPAAGVVYQYQDLVQKYDTLLAKAEREAGALVEAATVRAEAICRETYEQARAEGRSCGESEIEVEIQRRAEVLVEEQVSERIGTLAAALDQAVNALHDEQRQAAARWETGAVELAVSIAGKLLRKQLDANPDAAGAMVATALQLVSGSEQIEVRLHPDDLQLLETDSEARGVAGPAVLDAARLVADESIGRGGCLVRTADGEIDARLPTMLERIAGELLDKDAAA